MPLHPLVRQAAKHFKQTNPLGITIDAESDTIPQGRHPFAIYQWQFTGLREDLMLQPVCIDQQISQKILDLIEKGQEARILEDSILENESLEMLEKAHYELWLSAKQKHKADTAQLINYRRESLSVSHHARITLLQEQLDAVTEERIVRMRQSQIDNAVSDYELRIKELDHALSKVDINYHMVAIGFINIGKVNG